MDSTNSRSLDTLTIEELCTLARDASQASALDEYLGEDYRRALRDALSGSARGTARRTAGTVILLHGILGSQIGKVNRSREWDIVWLNPLAIRDGNMSRLKLAAGASKYGARGLIPMFYALLWARLKYWYGFTVKEFAYDWRLSVAESAEDLVDMIGNETSGPVYLVAHSMGGLVARAALPSLDARVERVIQLATPNYGSFSPVLTFRGQNEFINRILALDDSVSLTDQISKVVSTFQGLYELMPAPERFSAVNLFDPQVWPASPAVNPEVLARAKLAIESLPAPDPRIALIAGTNQPTITGMSRDSGTGEFLYTTTPAGDGTVPLQFARFDPSANIDTYLAEVTHNGIVQNGNVSAAIDELIRTGQTSLLPRDTGDAARRKDVPRLLDVSGAMNPYEGRRGDRISLADTRRAQREVLGPVQTTTAGPADGAAAVGRRDDGDGCDQGFKGVVVSRRRRRLRVILAQGDITRVAAHAHVIGVFEEVTPSGPAMAYDGLLGGALSDLFARRMFGGSCGRVYLLPTYKTPVPSELLAFAGLGSFPEFRPDVAQDVAKQVVLSLLRARAHELATVIFGGSFGDVRRNLIPLLRGFIAGLKEADRDCEFQRIILCERDPEKFRLLKDELYSLASSSLFDDVEVEFDIVEVPADRAARDSRAVAGVRPPQQMPVYLFSELTAPTSDSAEGVYRHDLSILAPSSGTTVPRFPHSIPKRELDLLLRETESGAPRDLKDFGDRLTSLVLPDELREALGNMISSTAIELVHDTLASRIPWEALRFGADCPAVLNGLTRKYRKQSTRSAAMFSDTQRQRPILSVLLVYNPTEDLDGAEKEGDRLLQIAARSGGKLVVDCLHGREATRDRVLARLAQDGIDFLHYAGHAGFEAGNPAQSGIVCAGGEVLSGRDLESLGSHLPPVIILNACQSGRVRRAGRRNVEPEFASASAAEAILNAGIMCFIATYWPVSDSGADIFAKVFYEQLLAGLKNAATPVPMGQAVLVARQALKEKNEDDWANYMLYGNADFVVKS